MVKAGDGSCGGVYWGTVCGVWPCRSSREAHGEVTMATRGRKPLSLRGDGTRRVLMKRNYSIEERYVRALTVLSAITGKELSLLVNEALADLVAKYLPGTKTAQAGPDAPEE